MYATRFAPSPTGYLHRGHAFSALSAYAAAQAEGGRFVLRVANVNHRSVRADFDTLVAASERFGAELEESYA